MHVMIATDGSLDAKKTATIAAKLASGGGSVTVVAVVEVPRQMLSDMRSAAANAAAAAAAAAPVEPEYRRTQAPDLPATHWAGDDAVVARYVDDVVSTRTAELVAELEAIGVEHTVVGIEGENAARSVLESAEQLQPDVLCLGTHGLGRFDGLLGSLSTKVARMAPCPVLLVR
jgi:nucleotide-binding universal stress UspA family protein